MESFAERHMVRVPRNEHEEDWGVRTAILTPLAPLPPIPEIPAAEAAVSSSRFERRRAAEVLPREDPLFLGLARDENYTVRAQVAERISVWSELFRRLLEDSNPYVREVARRRVGRLTALHDEVVREHDRLYQRQEDLGRHGFGSDAHIQANDAWITFCRANHQALAEFDAEQGRPDAEQGDPIPFGGGRCYWRLRHGGRITA